MSKKDILNLNGTTNWDNIANLLDSHGSSITNINKNKTYTTPEEFGAVGDGITDDTLAFTNALKQHRNVKCMAGKTYYFAGIVDASTMCTGILDLNGSFLKNFHIKINLKDNGYQSRSEWPIGWFKICNGTIGGDWGAPPAGWQTPAIQTGTCMYLQDLLFFCCPYIMAVTNNYRDFMRFDNIMNSSGYTFPAGSITLDAICGIIGDGLYANRDTAVFKNTPNSSQGTAGDGWIFTNCSEWHFDNNPDYSFITFVNNSAATVIDCIQTRFSVGTFAKATFIGCHWELQETYPTIPAMDYLREIVFINCYFYGAYVLETTYKNVTYMNCYFRVGPEQVPSMKNISFATNLKNLDFYHIKCKIINSMFGNSYIVTSDEIKSWKYLPKHTANYLASSYITNLSATPTTGTLSSGSWRFPEVGDYKYDIYLFASPCGIATEYAQITRTVAYADSACFSSSTYWGHSGGWGFIMFRTLPSGVIQKAEFWFNPYSEYQNSQYNLPIRFYDYGQWIEFQVADTEQYISPWITVSSVTSYAVNNKLFEKSGMLITSDNSSIGLSSANSYAQISNTYTASTISNITTSTATLVGNSTNLFDTTSNSIVATLPTAVGQSDPIVIKLKAITAGNTLTLKGNGTQTIDGQTSMVINTVNTALTLYSDGSNWYIV